MTTTNFIKKWKIFKLKEDILHTSKGVVKSLINALIDAGYLSSSGVNNAINQITNRATLGSVQKRERITTCSL